MNTPKLPPLPEALDEAIKEFARASMAYDPSRWTAANQQLKKAIEAYALAAIEAQGVPDGWKPIETAPKDGTPILLATQRGRIADGAWHQKYGVWGWPYVMVEPTHWMPLPATTNASTPPAPQAAVQQEPPQPPGFNPGWPFPVPQKPMSREEREVVVSSIHDSCDVIHAGVVQQDRMVFCTCPSCHGEGKTCTGPCATQPIQKAAQQAKPQPLSDEQVEDFRAAACKETYITRDDYHRAFHDGWHAAHGIKE